MILGLPVTGTVMLLGGATLFLLTLFQVLLGMRVIKLGKRHRIVHRWTAYAIMALAAIHGLLGVVYVTGARIG
jgi:cytochrome b561